MKLITKETDYAIRAIMHLARHDHAFVSSRSIASQENIPLHFLRRILQTLMKHGLVDSKEGASGGVRLKARPKDIHLIDVMMLLQGEIQLADCVFRNRHCSNRRRCVIRKRIGEIGDLVRREFKNTTIRDLLEDEEVPK